MQSPLEVVVLDDMSRFAGHVWQYLSQGMGFGIGRMSDDGKGDGKGQLTFRESEPHPTLSGDAQIRWINAGSAEWKGRLEEAVRDIGPSPSCFLIDVRGPLQASRADYDWKEAVRRVREGPQPDATVFLVSSYMTGTQLFRLEGLEEEELVIRPKTWRTLGLVAQQVRAQPEKLAGLHILVSGAGFELEESLGGAHGMGMPKTQKILKKGWQGCDYGDEGFEENGFPIPRKLAHGWPKGWPEESELEVLRTAAAKFNLDIYWNEALRLVLEKARLENSQSEVRDQKIAASLQEHKVRESFRQAFLNYDWGYLNQALDAATLDWTAWLSTNYTGFADRALVLAKRYGMASKSWNIVSTSNEAIQLIRSILHGDKVEPVLFKLHGHIEHLLTMAIAGQDKELYSTLSLPVDSLHEVYTAAEVFLKRRLQHVKGLVIWHVVGHSLKDALLVDVLKRVCGPDHKILFVGPDVLEKGEENRNHFEFLKLPSRSFVDVPLYADEYLSRLCSLGLSEADCGNLEMWRDGLLNRPHRPSLGISSR